MKKTIIILIWATVLPIIASAQLEIRPFLGMNFSDVTESPDGQSTQAKLGGQIGASVLIGNRFYLNPGIAYFSRSTEFSSRDNLIPDTDYDVSGVIIPLLVGYRFVDASTEPFLNFRVQAGPSLLFFTQQRFSEGSINEEVNWNENQWGGQVGAGLDVSIFFIDAMYEFGLSNNQKDGTLGIDGDNFKMDTFYINAGVRLSFSK